MVRRSRHQASRLPDVGRVTKAMKSYIGIMEKKMETTI